MVDMTTDNDLIDYPQPPRVERRTNTRRPEEVGIVLPTLVVTAALCGALVGYLAVT
jgi:hypothetical protein